MHVRFLAYTRVKAESRLSHRAPVDYLLFAAGETSPLPLQGEQRIPYKMPEPWQVGHNCVGALVVVVIHSDHTLYLLKARECCKYPGFSGIFTAGNAEKKGKDSLDYVDCGVVGSIYRLVNGQSQRKTQEKHAGKFQPHYQHRGFKNCLPSACGIDAGQRAP